MKKNCPAFSALNCAPNLFAAKARTGFALFKKTDPVLAFAANKFGAQLSAEKAGQFFFMRQKPEDEEKEADDSVN